MAAISGVSSNFNQHQVVALQAQGKEKTQQPTWIEYATVVSAIALGVLCFPNFAIGLGVGALETTAWTIILLASAAAAKESKKPEKTEEDDYGKSLQKKGLFDLTILGPAQEELWYRGVIQTVISVAARFLLPIRSVQFFIGPPIAIATLVSVVATALLFANAHRSNPHEGAGTQSVRTFFSGLLYGGLRVHYGLAAAVGGHIANNTIITTIYFQTKKLLDASKNR